MALNDLSKFIDNSIEKGFNEKPYDPKAGRKKVAGFIDTAKRQFESGTTKAPNRMWRAGNRGIAFTLKVNGNEVPVLGRATNFSSNEQFPKFLDALKREVEAGSLDAEIKEALANKGTGGSSSAGDPGPQPSPDHVLHNGKWRTKKQVEGYRIAAAARAKKG